MRTIRLKSPVRILPRTVLVAALLPPGGPSAADEGDGGGKIVFSRRVSGVAGAGNTELIVRNADGSGSPN